MSQMDDDSVEKFFRQADPSRFDTTYNEDDWKKMEEMLDREKERLAALKNRRLTYGIITAVLLIAFSVSWYVLRESEQLKGSEKIVNESGRLESAPRDTNSIKENQEALADQELNRANGSSEAQSKSVISVEPKNETVIDNQVNDGKVDQQVTHDEREKSKNNFNRQATSDRSTDVKVNKERVTTEVDATKSGLILSNDVMDKSSGNMNGDQRVEVMAEENNQAVNNKNESKVDPEQRAPLTSTITDSVAVKQDSVQLADALVQAEEAEEQQRESEDVHNRWMVSVAVAPDFSRTTYSGYDSPGDAFGVFVHYQFMKRWSVSTGILRSDKKYWGYGDEYNPPPGYWDYVTNGVVPEKVDGNCLVLEVPLSLAYNFVETRRSRVFATAGISSYFMRSEEYTYTFDEPNPGSANGWSTDKPSSYWFGIGSLSVGYDFRVSPTLSFGLEPYYRIPFAEVGWANVDLYSLGFLFNARYRFLKKGHLSSPGVLK